MDHRLALSVAAVAVLATACGQQDTQSTQEAVGSAPASPSASASPSRPASTEGTPGASEDEPALAGCERYADPTAASRAADQPVLDVLAEDPSLSWFSAALSGQVSPEVDYRDVLVGGPFTVFAPVDAAVGEQTRQELSGDPAALRFFLDYHVVPGQALSPQELIGAAAQTSSRAVDTLQGWDLTVFAPRDGSSELAVTEDTVVPLCGDIPTTDARLYLVPELLHPAGDYTIPGSDWGTGGVGAVG